ncbi:T9SS type B sorting domain-containing protein [Psychroserpens damuponensis]|uniref:T9SS type B sorting domain-containing protein n=1 Tax=Psychroserpens damuponensis TaxID=943936 RepID=UPI0005900D45|nr:gliding motility-associated C-terminal domain-containing protein [Psychroserpens damuponensis]
MIKQIKFLIILSSIFTLFACGNDDNNTQETQDVFEGCCSPDPVFGPNVDNLDQSAGEIKVDNIFTPNGDAFNDVLEIENIDLYDNHSVTIYDINDNIIFESNNYGNENDLFPIGQQGENGVVGTPDGTYKYKVVIENEGTFRESGTFCLFTQFMNVEQNFSECNPLEEGFDPIISGN